MVRFSLSLAVLGLVMTSALSIPIINDDDLFTESKYDLARDEYQRYAREGRQDHVFSVRDGAEMDEDENDNSYEATTTTVANDETTTSEADTQTTIEPDNDNSTEPDNDNTTDNNNGNNDEDDNDKTTEAGNDNDDDDDTTTEANESTTVKANNTADDSDSTLETMSMVPAAATIDREDIISQALEALGLVGDVNNGMDDRAENEEEERNTVQKGQKNFENCYVGGFVCICYVDDWFPYVCIPPLI